MYSPSMARLLATLGCVAGLVGCTASGPAYLAPRPSPALLQAEAAFQRANPAARDEPPERASYEELRRLDQRVADVAFKLAASNAELCPDRAPLSGLALHTLSQYGEETRPLVERVIGRSGLPAVLTVAAGSPAEQAGIRADDVLLSIAGQPFAAQTPDPGRAAGQLLAAQRTLADGLARSAEVGLTVQRGERTLSLPIRPVAGCTYDVVIETGAKFGSAGAYGGTVFLADRSVAFTRDADELAVLIGHELAHNILGHAASAFGSAPLMRSAAEQEADYLGLYLAARAGYDTRKAVPYWRRLVVNFPQLPFDWLLHPLPLERVAAIAAMADEIEAKRAAGSPLAPNRTTNR